MSQTQIAYTLKSRPAGMVGAEHFERQERPLPVPGDGEVLVRTQYISLDPAMRGWLNEGKSYVPPVGIGEVMRAIAVGEIMASNSPDFAVGEHVTGMFGVQQYCAGSPKALNLNKVNPDLVPLQRYLGALGMPGMTAYFGILEVLGEPQPGQTVVVSGAAGAVGSMVGQIAKIKGARAVGIAGGPDKCREVVEEYGFDACVDYRSQDVQAGLKQHCPQGIDVYFDNVGGEILEAALARLAMHGRIIICGAISQYNNADNRPVGPRNYLSLLVNRGTMKGMVVFDHQKKYAQAGMQIAQWMQQGKLTVKEHVVEGLDSFPDALGMLFSGGNHGKLVLKV